MFRHRMPLVAVGVLALSLGTPVAEAAVKQAHLIAPDGETSDTFGNAVAVMGDIAVVGSSSEDVGDNWLQGSVYVFARTGEIWTLSARLVADDGAAHDYFGSSVSLDGETLAVGAPGDDVGDHEDQGSAYIFTLSGNTWTQQAHLTSVDARARESFGQAISVSGDTVLVGAPAVVAVDDSIINGAAYVYVRTGTSWAQQVELLGTDNLFTDGFGFGWSVDLDGDTAIIGAWGDDVGGDLARGSAYIFSRSGSAWAQQAHLRAAKGEAGDYFGNAVALDGDTAVVGALFDDVDGESEQGSTYVFIRSGKGWSQQAHLVAAEPSPEGYHGMSVAIDGDTVLVGGSGDSVGDNLDQGSAYVFTRLATSWTQVAQLTAADGEAGDSFGSAVALDGDTAVVSATWDDIGANEDQGSATVFTRDRPTPTGADDRSG